MNAHQTRERIYHPSDMPGYVEAHLGTDDAALILLAAKKRQEVYPDKEDEPHGVSYTLSTKVSSTARLIIEITQEKQLKEPVEEIVEWYGLHTMAETLEQAVAEGGAPSLDRDVMLAHAQEALDLAERMRADKSDFELQRATEADKFSKLFDEAFGPDGFTDAA